MPLTIGETPLKTARNIAVRGDAPPKILALGFSSLDVHMGQDWTGQAITTSNVARLDFETNLFHVQADRVAPGRFAFRFHILDLVPIGVRAYTLHVTATAADGRSDVTALPMRLDSRLL